MIYREEELIDMVKKEISICPICKKDIPYQIVHIKDKPYLNGKCDCGFFTSYDEELIQISFGNIDELGGTHDQGLGWNPNGVYCGECSNSTCAGCPHENFTLLDEYKRESKTFLSQLEYEKAAYCKCDSDKPFKILLLEVNVEDLVLKTKEVIDKNDYSDFEKKIIERLSVQETYSGEILLYFTIAYCEPCKKVICKINTRNEFVFYIR